MRVVADALQPVELCRGSDDAVCHGNAVPAPHHGGLFGQLDPHVYQFKLLLHQRRPQLGRLPSLALEGYASGNASFTSFHTGVYTVAAEDAWGQTAIRHFEVVAPASALTCATAASSLDFVALSNETSGPGPVRLDAYYRQLGGNDTYLLALSRNGSSPATLAFFNYAEIVQEGGLHELNAPLFFSPDPNQPQSWLYLTQNGTLAYPATFYPVQCTLVRIVLPQHSSSEIQLRLQFSDNETQQLTLEP